MTAPLYPKFSLGDKQNVAFTYAWCWRVWTAEDWTRRTFAGVMIVWYDEIQYPFDFGAVTCCSRILLPKGTRCYCSLVDFSLLSEYCISFYFYQYKRLEPAPHEPSMSFSGIVGTCQRGMSTTVL